MATIRIRGKTIYIQWYDPFENKVTCKSTKLSDNETNRKKAELMAKKLQNELNNKHSQLKQLGIRPTTIKEAFEHFLRNNQQKHKFTIYEYNRFFTKFIEFFDEDSSCNIINKIQVENWLNHIKALNYKKNTIHTYGKQCIHFLNFLFEYNYIPMFKINRNVKTKPEIGEKIVFSDDDIRLIFNSLSEKNHNFYTAIYLAFYTGLRSSDLLTISVERINLSNRVLTYYSPKRKKFREIAFHKTLVPILKERIEELKSGPILQYNSIHNLGRAVERYLISLNIKSKGYSTRTFRKTFITLCRSRFNMDASIVRELVGHEHGNTTDRYYNQISINAMKNELEKFEDFGGAL